MSDFLVIRLPTHSDARGSLTVAQKSLPFEPVRSYWIYGADGQTRGGHRHRHTRQALIAVHGEVRVHMNDGRHREDVLLAHPGDCLLVEPEDWHTMHFGPGSVLLVFSSHPYDRSEYIDEPYA
jgi:dTDP-4-dehydrorhamnose 3,5-epimerase-like enzyme